MPGGVADLETLLVEDEYFMLDLVHAMLRKHEIESMHPAVQLEIAIQYLESQRRFISAVIFDLNMPGVGGVPFLRNIRNGMVSGVNDVPVTVLTGNSASENLAAVLELGFSGYLVKPGSIGRLRNALESSLKGRLFKRLAVEG